MNQRTKKIQQELPKHEINALLISNHHNIRYLSEFVGLSPYEREAWILITPQESYFFTNSLYYPKAKESQKEYTVFEITPDNSISYYLQKLLPKKTVLGFESQSLLHLEFYHFDKTFRNILLKPTQYIVEKLRWYKDPREMEYIKKAMEIIDNIWIYGLKNIKTGQTEKEIAYNFERHIRESEAEDIAWRPIIVASGENSANPHHVTSDRKTTPKDLILIDMGAKYHGYVSDFSRVIFTTTPTTQQEKAYHAVVAANEAAEKNIKVGIETTTLDTLARKELSKYGFKDESQQYPHLLGHGIGLEIHEKPSIGMYTTGVIEDNTAFTIEPAVYLERMFGIRIEDTVIIENGEPKILTQSSKEIVKI